MLQATLTNKRGGELARYERHLYATAQWLARSFEHGEGGSCAHYARGVRWSKPYPETTGYSVPTLLRLHADLPELGLLRSAQRAAHWLLSIQNADGSWNGGLHPARRPRSSVFNTGQILKGLVAMHAHDGERLWIDAARRASRWLAARVEPDGSFAGGDYRSPRMPSYYTHVAWPMLEVWKRSGDATVRAAALRVLDQVVARRNANGSFAEWGFEPEKPAVTHTIGYTLRGFLESARLLDDWERYGEPCREALEFLARQAELSNGRLAGAYDAHWRGSHESSCLTGNAQTALNLLLLEERAPDLGLVNAAAKLVDQVCATQRLRGASDGVRGAVAGSDPIWGSYMRLRYPNWAAKYHCDALFALRARLLRERAT